MPNPDPMKTPERDPAGFRRVLYSSMLGTAIEWYDFFLYGTAAALVFNQLFFPQLDPVTGTLASFASYAVGFFARPLGGIIFGHFGDRLGRKSTLVATLVMMGAATCLVGLLPTYAQIGLWAPALLVLLRVVQGIAVGGEWGGAVLLVAEHAEPGRRGFHVSLVQAGVGVGLLLANGVFMLCSKLDEAAFLSWGWRVPFLLGSLLTLLGLFIRLRVLESPLFAAVKDERKVPRVPLFEVWRTQRREVLLAMGARLAENGFFYILTVWVLSYATTKLGVARGTMLNAVLIGSALQLLIVPWFGALSDRVGRRPVYLGGTVFLLIFAFALFPLLGTRDPLWISVAIIAGLLGHAALYGPQAALFAELFGTRTRYTGASLGYQLAAPLAGGLAPLVASSLLGWSGGAPWPVAVYLAVLAVVTIVSILLVPETSRSDLAQAGGAAAGQKDA